MEELWLKIPGILKMLMALPFVADARTALRFYRAILLNLPRIARDGNLSAPFAAMWGKPCRFRFFDARILLEGVSFGYASEIYARRCYTPPGFRIEKGDVVIDLGASLGPFSIAAALLGGRVVAVDPNQESLAVSRRQAEANRCLDRIKIVWGAVGAGGACADLVKLAPALDLNQLIEESDFGAVDFLKIDIGGSEFDLLGRNAKWLEKVRKIAMGVHPTHGRPDELKAILEAAGFSCFFRDASGRKVSAITGARGGYLFAAREGYASASRVRRQTVSGIVVKGKGRGRALGFPTANIPAPAEAPDGVFAAWVILGLRRLPSIVFIGAAETFGEKERFAEAHILDFSEEISGREIVVNLLYKIRDSRKFNGEKELVTAMQEDEKAARAFFSRCSAGS